MTLRSEIYSRMLRSSSILGRGVCGSALGLAMPASMLKDSKRRRESVEKKILYAMTHA